MRDKTLETLPWVSLETPQKCNLKKKSCLLEAFFELAQKQKKCGVSVRASVSP